MKRPHTANSTSETVAPAGAQSSGRDLLDTSAFPMRGSGRRRCFAEHSLDLKRAEGNYMRVKSVFAPSGLYRLDYCTALARSRVNSSLEMVPEFFNRSSFSSSSATL